SPSGALSRLPHPPTSTLFPYTTLFRSRVLGSAQREAGDTTATALARRPSRVPRAPARPVAVAAPRDGAFAVPAVDCPLELPQTVDRKSTRLNSSHQIISYAVFCLKKKQ